MLVSPYSWLEEYTAVDQWVGGTEENPDSAAEVEKLITSQEGGNNLQLIYRQNMPFLIREHERKFQYGVSECTVWRKPI